MAYSAIAPAPLSAPALPTLPIRDILTWAVFFGILMLVLLYFVGVEQGSLSVMSGAGVHDWVHDGRHLLGFPCH